MKTTALILAAFPAAISLVCNAAPVTFDQAKIELRERVYFDRNLQGDTYCGCQWQWVGRTGGRVALDSCGYQIRALPERASRIEYEHIAPAWTLGHQRQCWQKGGRENCAATDPIFRAMEADAHNLTIVVGEVNADRAHYNFVPLSSTPYQYGSCRTRVDFKRRAAEPRDEAKGFVARVQFYMHDWYGLDMSRQQQQIFSAWDRMYPVSAWERERDMRIAKVMGHHNPYVTGERTWTLGQRPRGDGLSMLGEGSHPVQVPRPSTAAQPSQMAQTAAPSIIGSRNSRVYHLPNGCPSYALVREHNRVYFQTAEQAEQAGFRLAGNCK
ncbi:deoxyribonuclease I (plasmid) [Stutzerimonas degradans]|nr:deoxyribonuclease I [Stutzerimonas degradans]